MMANDVVVAQFTYGNTTRTRGLYQWDYGITLRFDGLELPSAYTVHFANQLMAGNAKTQVGNADGVSIPDEYLITGLPVYAWVYLHTGESDGETVYAVTIPVTKRPQPVEDAPTPVQQGVIDQAIAALNDGVEAAEAAKDAIEDMDVSAGTLPAGSSATVTKSVDPETGAVTLAFGIPKGDKGDKGDTGATGQTGPAGHDGAPGQDGQNGADGKDGADGEDGADGVSPTVAVTDITGGHRVTITDADGVKTFDVMDGADGQTGQTGQTGPAGADGYSPTASVSKSGSTATITITDKNGTTTAQVIDGQNGQDGTPGVGVPTGGTQGQVLKKKSGTNYDTEWGNEPTVPVTDVQVNGTSVLSSGVANVPVASGSTLGTVKVLGSSTGIKIDSGYLMINGAVSASIKKASSSVVTPIVPALQHESTFYGLATAAGDTTQKQSSNAVGTYTEAAKMAILTMLGLSAIIGNAEGATASKSYAVGDAFLHSGTLYKVTAAIASGSAIVPGTNCAQTTIINLIKGV